MSRIAEALKRATQSEGRDDHRDDALESDFAGTDTPARLGEQEFVKPAAPAADAPRGLTDAVAPIRRRAADEPPQRGVVRFEGFNTEVSEKLVVTSRLRQSVVEQYRKLAAALHHSQADRGIRIVMVASALPGEGKTLTATNLALTLSESYRRQVLLMDADLRRPNLHEIFGVSNTSGLTDGLKGTIEAPLPVVRVSEYLSVLTAGSPDPDPMSLIISSRMRQVVGDAAAKFDWVVIDTPPVELLTDANLLAAMVDAVVLVIRAGQTPHALVKHAIDALGRERVLGIVLNRAQEGSVLRSADYYGYNYVGSRR